MEGFYSKQQTAQILGVSVRQVCNYQKSGHLRTVYSGRRAWIPREDVQVLLDRTTMALPPSHNALVALKEEVEKLQREVEVLKLGLGFGAKAKPRDGAELLLLRQSFIDLLAKTKWTNKQISGVADEMMKLQTVEVTTLMERIGPSAWLPMQQLVERMLSYIESHEDYPAKGLDSLEARLIKAKDRFFGLMASTTKLSPQVDQKKVSKLLEAISAPKALDSFILAYINARK